MKEYKEAGAAEWDHVIEAQTSLFDLRLKEVWHYRDLLVLFVRRDFVTVYKQTILGPLWFLYLKRMFNFGFCCKTKFVI